MTKQEEKFWLAVKLQMRAVCNIPEKATETLVSREIKRINSYGEQTEAHKKHTYNQGVESTTFWLAERLYEKNNKKYWGFHATEQEFWYLKEKVWKIKNMYRLVKIRDFVFGSLIDDSDELSDQFRKEKAKEIAWNIVSNYAGSEYVKRLEEEQEKLLSTLEKNKLTISKFHNLTPEAYEEAKDLYSNYKKIRIANGLNHLVYKEDK